MNLPHFYIYDASAGSGKTYTIACKYLCILLQQDQVFAFQNILAITFTNKAAAEMKQRIIKALIYFSGLDSEESYESLLEDVAKETRLNKAEIQKKSLQILKYLIPNYAGFEVSTIDSFNHRIIKTFAKDLSLIQNFEIDLEPQPYIQKAVDSLIEDVGHDIQLTEWLVDFVHYKIERDKSGDISLDLKNYAELALNENNYKAIEQIQNYSLNDLKQFKYQTLKYRDQIKEKLIDIGQDFFHLLNKQDVEKEIFPRQTIPNYFKNLIEGKIVSNFDAKWHDIAQTSFYKKTVKDTVKVQVDLIRIDIEKLFLRSKELSLNYHLSEKVLKSFVPLSMISEIQRRISQIKAEEGILFVNDFNRIISKHIRHQPAPFIYERLGEKFRHYFIDEFQDTSRLQWQNLIPLVDNAITTEHSDGTSGSLYLVGDVKQSIYEWRGGDPQQFLDLSQGRAHPFSIDAKKIVLEKNWRSAKTIVEFNNDFFEHAANFLTNPNHQSLYKSADQIFKKNNTGYVEIRFLQEKENKDLMNKQRIDNLSEIILSIKDQGFSLGDVCILVRQNKFGTKIAEEFNALDNPIPVVSQESLLIASDVKVQLLFQFLRLLEQYEQETCVDFMLMWFNHSGFDKELYHESLHKIKNLKLEEFFDYINIYNLDFDISIFQSLSLYDKVEYALRTLKIDTEANAYIQFFLDEVFEFSISKSNSMSVFLNYWEDQKSKKSISTSQTQDAVNIMTIHKSKGLEFPIVIYAHSNFTLADLRRTEDWVQIDQNHFGIPFIYERISKSSKSLNPFFEKAYYKNISSQELASLNTAYVCMTRAVEQLYILSEPTSESATSFSDILESFLKTKELYKGDKNHYSFGCQTFPRDETIKTLNLKYSNFKSYPAQKFYVNLTADNILDEKNTKAITYGQEVHDYLQKVEYSLDIKNSEIPKNLKSMLHQVVHHPDLKKYFESDWEIYNETDIAFNSKILRPDRICIKDNEAVIIDYKTGQENPAYATQLTNYKTALEAMNYSVKASYLVYIRKNIKIESL